MQLIVFIFISFLLARMSMYRPHWMPSVGDPGGYNGQQTHPPPLHPPTPHQASAWPTPPPSARLASSSSPPLSYSANNEPSAGGGGANGTTTSGNQQLPPTPPKDSHNIPQSQSQDHQLGHHPHAQMHSHPHQPKHEPASSNHYPDSQPNSGCLIPSGSASYETSTLSRDDNVSSRLNSDRLNDQQYNQHHPPHQHESKDNLLSGTTKSELNPPSILGPASLDIKNQPQSPLTHGSTYEHHPPSSSDNSYNTGASGIGNEHDGYASNAYSNIQTSSASAYSPPLHHSHHQGQPAHHSAHHPSSGSSLLGAPMSGDPGVRGSASSTGGSDYSANNISPPINHSGMSDAGLSNYSSSGHVGAIRPNSAFNSSTNTSKGSAKGKNRPNAGNYEANYLIFI